MKKIILDQKQVEELAAQGLSQVKAAEELGISVNTFFNKLKLDAELKAAWKRGLAKQQNGTKALPSNGSTSSTVDEAPEEKLRALIHAGVRDFNELQKESGLGFNALEAALYRMEHELREIEVEQVNGSLRHRRIWLKGEREKDSQKTAPAPVAEKPKRVTAEVVGSSRTESAVERAPRTR